MPTNVPPASLTPQGFVVPEELAILTGVLADLSAAFGGNLNTALTSPQGQLATSLAAMLGATYDQFLLLANQVDPAYADGRMQDALARLYFLTRRPAVPTTVTALVNGRVGTVIPAGSLAQASDGTIFETQAAVTITPGGNATVIFRALVDGPADIPAGALNRIYRAVPGWDAVTNLIPGIPGRNAETRAEFEARRVQSVALNAVGILPAVRAAVLAVPDVVDAYVTENFTGSATTIGGVSIPAHSLYVAAVGGTDEAVARAIWTKKNPGCGYAGGTTVTVVDDTNGYALPYPTYPVKFTRPVGFPIYVAVEINNNSGVPSDALDQVRGAVVAAFDGATRIGATVFASRFYPAVAALGAWARIVTIKVGSTPPGTFDDVTVNIDQIPTIATGNVSLTLT